MSEQISSKQNTARLQIILAMAAFGTIGAFVKNIQLPAAEIALYRAVIASVCLFLFMLAGGKLSALPSAKGMLWMLFLSGAAMGFNWILLFEAYRHTSVALSTLSYYFAPTVVIIASAALFREKLTAKQTVCFLASTAGLVLVIGVSGGGGDMTGVLCGLGAALLYAAVVLMNKAAVGVGGVIRTWVQFTSAAVILLPYVFFTCGFHIAELNSAGLFSLLIVGTVHTGIIYCLYFASLAYLKGQQAAILSYIDPVVAVLVSVLWLGESITRMQLAGGGMILFFAAINELRFDRAQAIWKPGAKKEER